MGGKEVMMFERSDVKDEQEVMRCGVNEVWYILDLTNCNSLSVLVVHTAIYQIHLIPYIRV